MSGFQSHRRLEGYRWLGMPFALSIIATMVFALPIRVFGLQLPEPVFAFVPAFAWAMIRPSITAPFLLLLLGLFQDLYWGASLGLWAVALITAYAFVLVFRSMMSGQGRLIIWIWYCAACGVGYLAAFLLTMLDVLRVPNLIASGLQLAMIFALYPLAHMLIERFDDSDIRFR